jgi:GNAT superfamily N-acetyltransferase
MTDSWSIAAALAYTDDYPGCSALRASLHAAKTDRALPDTILLSEERERRVVAGALIRPSLLLENCFDLSWVFVAKKYRGQGIGTKIVLRAINMIEVGILNGERGSILIQVLDHNIPFYERFGFITGARLHDGLTMVRIANPHGSVPDSVSKYVSS